MPQRHLVSGTISSAAFDGGHRFVVGRWVQSPIGPFGDVMWTGPNDRRILIAPSETAAEYVTSIYRFEEVRVEPLYVGGDNHTTIVSGPTLEMQLFGGRRFPPPRRRPLAVTRFLEGPIARWAMGVRTYGRSPTGALEWYQSGGWRWVAGGRARLYGADLGDPRRIDRPIGVGFSEPPGRPSIVSMRVTVEPPATGR